MKPIKAISCALVLAALVSGAVSADGPVFNVSIDAVRDMLFIKRFTGDYAVKTPDIQTTPYPYQGDGEIKFFQPSAFSDNLIAQVRAAYTGEHFGGLFQIKAINSDKNIFNSDWEAWIRLGAHVRLLTGNQAQRGGVAQYQNFDDFLSYKIDNLGIMVPTLQQTPKQGSGNNLDQTEFPYGFGAYDESKHFITFAGSEAGDLFVPAGSTARLSGLLGDFVFAPFTVTASVGGLYENLAQPFKSPWIKDFGTTLPIYDSINDLLLTTSTNFGLRIEGAEIADMLTMSCIYKYAASSLTKNLNGQEEKMQLDEKINNHAFGVYANIKVLDTLGISAGYSGLYQSWSNGEKSTIPPSYVQEHILSEKREAFFPFLNGVDLRAHYTGIDRLAITFNNNVSFASAQGVDNYLEHFAKGWAYEEALNENAGGNEAGRTENYFGYYVAIGAKYNISNTLTTYLQLANQLGVFSLKWEYDSIRSWFDYLSLYAGASYHVIDKPGFRASVRGGLDLKLNTYSYQEYVTDDLNIFKTGYIEFGIPIGLKIEF